MEKEIFFKDKNLPHIECRYTTKSSKHYKPHMHTTLSIGAIDQGEVIYSVADKKANLKSGSLALINPDTIHHCNPVGDAKRSYYMLYIDTSYALKIQSSLFGNDSFIPLDSILLQDKKIYEKYIDSMDFFMGENFLIEKEQKIINLLETIFLKTIKHKKIKSQETPLHVNRVKEILAKDLDLDLSLNDMAKALKSNPYTLLRDFKKETGITPHAYRMNLRIEMAKKLLQKGASISQTAQECGFFDQSHLHRHFKAITAVTPKGYRLNFIQ